LKILAKAPRAARVHWGLLGPKNHRTIPRNQPGTTNPESGAPEAAERPPAGAGSGRSSKVGTSRLPQALDQCPATPRTRKPILRINQAPCPESGTQPKDPPPEQGADVVNHKAGGRIFEIFSKAPAQLAALGCRTPQEPQAIHLPPLNFPRGGPPCCPQPEAASQDGVGPSRGACTKPDQHPEAAIRQGIPRRSRGFLARGQASKDPKSAGK
jgi:hypothetical protein